MSKGWRYLLWAAVVLAASAAVWSMVRYTRAVDERLTRSLSPEEITLRFFKDPQAVKPFRVTSLDGRTITSDSLRGKVVLVNFWATWCPPCRAEIPDLVALQEKYPDHLQILGISEDEGSVDVVRQFAAEQKVNYPIVMLTPELEEIFRGVNALPTSFVVDRDGRIVQKHIGLLNASVTEHETRVLAGLTLNARIERVDPEAPVGLENAAQAKEIPGIELAKLTPDQRTEALQKLNTAGCTCGCGLSVARCRVEDPHCPVSLPLAQKMVEGIVASR